MNNTKYFVLQAMLRDYQEFHQLYLRYTALGPKQNIANVEKLRGDMSKASKGLKIRANLWKDLLEGPTCPQVQAFLLNYEKKDFLTQSNIKTVYLHQRDFRIIESFGEIKKIMLSFHHRNDYDNERAQQILFLAEMQKLLTEELRHASYLQ